MNELTSGMEAALAGIPNTSLAVAVSGGGDSIALLHMLAERGTGLRAVTVDHGLRKESAAEAEQVATACANLGIAHTTLRWQGWDKSGNLQDEARRARLRLIAEWAADQNIAHIALGHTLDDQAETVLMRLARGSGVDGLAGMATSRKDGALTWLRPILHAKREDLRVYLTDKGIDWIDDPTNDDPKYTRVRARQALSVLGDLGIDADGLVATASRMRDAREALETATLDLVNRCAEISGAGEIRLNEEVFNVAPDELRFRLLATALQWISGATYRPRFDSLQGVLARVDRSSGQTLHGCTIRSIAGNIVIRREPAKVSPPCATTDIWDHRWLATNRSGPPASRVGALGQNGLLQCKNWRETGHAREALLASPALWEDGQLIAAPLAGMVNGWEIKLKEGKKGLHIAVMTR